MALRGDLSEFNLADLFQTLSMNRQVGTLLVTGAGKQASIYFDTNGIRLLTSEECRFPRLGEILVSRSIITDDQVKEALDNQHLSKGLLGEIFVELEHCTQEQIEDCVRSQIEEIIYDVFSWKSAKFEFQAGEPRGEFFDPTNLGRCLAFNVSGIIMEAARRIDEWEVIRSSIPNFGIVLAPIEDAWAVEMEKELEYRTEDVNRILTFIDGKKTVSKVCTLSPFSDFDTCKILAVLVTNAQVRPLTPDETVTLAEQYAGEGNIEEAAKLFESAVASAPGDIQLHFRLAQSLETIGRATDAAHEYVSVGLAYVACDDRDNAKNCFKKAAGLAPRNFAAHQNLYEVYIKENNYTEAVKEAILLARAYDRLGRRPEAREILEKTMPLQPDSIELKSLLAEILVELEENEQAVALLEELSSLYIARNKPDRAIPVYRKILSLDRTRSDIQSRLDKVASSVLSKKQDKGNIGSKIALLVVIVILLTLVGGGYYYETSVVRPQFNALKDEGERVVELTAQAGHKVPYASKFTETIEKLEKFKVDYSFSIFMMTSPDVDREIQVLRAARKALDDLVLDERRREIKAIWDVFLDGQVLYHSIKYEQALKKYEEMEKNIDRLPDDKLRQARREIDRVRTYLEEAAELNRKITKLERNGDFRGAHRSIKKLIDTYPNARLTQVVKYPIRITSTPSKAQITLNGKPLRGVVTPYTHYFAPGALLTVKVSKRSFTTVSRDITGLAEAAYKLEKRPSWRVRLKGLIDSAPVIKGNTVFASTTAGHLYAVSTAGNRKWSFEAREPLAHFPASPTVAGDLIIVGSFNKLLYGIDIEKGEKRWAQTLGNIIQGSPSKPDSRGNVYIGASDRRFYAIGTGGRGSIQWSINAGKKPFGEIDSSVVYHDNCAFFGDDNCRFYCVNTENKSVVWTYEVGAAVRSTPVIHSETGMVYFGAEDGIMHALRITDGKNRWRFRTGGKITGKCAIGKGLVFVGSHDGNVYAITINRGKSAWSFPTGGPVSGAVAYHDGVLYAGSQSKKFFALKIEPGRSTPKVLFKYETRGSIKGGVVACDGWVVFGSKSILFGFEQ